MTVGIIGLGYVGLPLALTFAEAGISVLGFDIDAHKVEQLSQGYTYFKHIPKQRVAAVIDTGLFKASTKFPDISACEAIIICVPTPLNRYREPDISYVLKTGEAIAEWLKPGMLVVLESTTYPGTTEGELRRVLEDSSGLLAGKDFHLAYSPEREDPGNPQSKVKVIPKVVGGYTSQCLDRVKDLYSHVVETVVPVSSCRVAEATKLTENIFRSVNIALVNELKMVYGAMDIDIWEVLEAAKTKPFGFMPFYPWPGFRRPLYPNRSVLFNLESAGVRATHPLYRVGWGNQSADACLCGGAGGECPQLLRVRRSETPVFCYWVWPINLMLKTIASLLPIA
jgi:UDP-N-acetyl-D-glucosamine dehydrogenase